MSLPGVLSLPVSKCRSLWHYGVPGTVAFSGQQAAQAAIGSALCASDLHPAPPSLPQKNFKWLIHVQSVFSIWGVLLSARSDSSSSGKQKGPGTASPGWEETPVQGCQEARVEAPPQGPIPDENSAVWIHLSSSRKRQRALNASQVISNKKFYMVV